jgi:ketosteroid isomerase-like protein
MRPSYAAAIALAVVATQLPAGVPPAAAHPPTQLNASAAQGVSEEILDFRRRMAAAIAAKDVTALRGMYADTFQHIHTSAKSDGRDTRIVTALAGEPVIETAKPTDLVVHVHAGGWAAVVTGTSPIKAMSDGKTYAVRWTQMFVREDTAWRLVASQATRGAELTVP